MPQRPSLPSPGHQSRGHQGFNLIEAAIVLGVVGLVIGGIWSAAAWVSAEQQRVELQKGIYFIANKVRQVFPQSYFTPDFTSVELWQSADMGVLPAGWVMSYTDTRNPLQATVLINLLNGPPRVFYQIGNLKMAECSRLTTFVANRANQGFGDLSNVPAGAWSCDPNTPNTVRFSIALFSNLPAGY